MRPCGVRDLLRQGLAQMEPPLQALGTDELMFHAAVRTLGSYSLLRRDPAAQSLSLHRLVQAVLIDSMPQQIFQAWVERTFHLLSSVRPESNRVTFPAWPAWERLLPHANHETKAWIKHDSDFDVLHSHPYWQKVLALTA